MARDIKKVRRQRRQRRIRKKIFGAESRPRANVFRSLKHLYVQLTDDLEGKVVLAVSTRQQEFARLWREKFPEEPCRGANIKAAQVLGEILAERAQAKGFRKVVFDRSGYLYHGRVKTLAESSREHGLDF